MFNCNEDIRTFHNKEVTLNDTYQSEMRDRRNANRKRLKNGLEVKDYPSLNSHQVQGSYAMHTMVQDKDNDYDIDDGVIFMKEDLKGSQGADKTALAARKMVCDALKNASFSIPPEVLKNCVRVRYQQGYHVDIPIYRKLGDESLELASSDWKGSSPSEVTNWYNNAVCEKSPDVSNGRQLRRMTRLLKFYNKSRASWKPRMPSGFVISVLVVECYIPDVDRDDISFYETIKAIYNRLNSRLAVSHPVRDEMLTEADDARTKFLREHLFDALKDMGVLFNSKCTRLEALKAWKKVYNEHEFWNECVKKEESKQQKADLLKGGNSKLATTSGLIAAGSIPGKVACAKQTEAYGGNFPVPSRQKNTVRKMVGKPPEGLWYFLYKKKLFFESCSINEYPSIRVKNFNTGHKLKQQWRQYKVNIILYEYDVTRTVTIKLFPNINRQPEVTVDGPKESPHRYNKGRLCMWYPMANKDKRWVFEDGLLLLLVMIEAHLFREEWWRERGEWLGPERSHEEPEFPFGS